MPSPDKPFLSCIPTAQLYSSAGYRKGSVASMHLYACFNKHSRALLALHTELPGFASPGV